ncbi:hypothetical protein BDF20DRAFT_111410 [Mycotypha africana]|uniref:uncharacterized protein n=1 Tax=Mycotypha africana TaxID=64632 RepID=UPI002301A664|nr:uncharacterized protein BDF20DRAFT_111410 [Mycotypha africana]KAI8970194.1 hypothetical protein BDF20DRAFT_111410 [Mycotypha africana]
MRNSDGPLWVEYLTAMLNDADLYTFARVGATVNNSLVFRPQPDFSGQVYRYTLTEDTTEPKYDKLYFIWLGGNDIAELYNNKKYPNNNVERDRILNDTQFTIRYNLEKLYETGARYIICLGVNPTHLYPANNDKTEEFRQSYKESIMKFNERLQTNIEDLNSRHNDSKAVFFETYKLFYSFFPEQTIMENSKWHCNYSAICNG